MKDYTIPQLLYTGTLVKVWEISKQLRTQPPTSFVFTFFFLTPTFMLILCHNCLVFNNVLTEQLYSHQISDGIIF